MKKIDVARALIQQNQEIFKCPKCGKGMELQASNSLRCKTGHCFDLSKNGYINLLLGSVKTEYDKDMLESRNLICRSGFFDPMLCGIVETMTKWMGRENDPAYILDVGCGEGSHLADISAKLHEGTGVKYQGVGIDISKEGIQIASREYSGFVWCVADLARNPFGDEKFDIILNIFSPSNYSEFNRIIKDNGILLKVVPGSEYLKELREAFYDNTDKESYSNERVVNHFSHNYEILETHEVKYKSRVTEDNLKHLISMTPLSWSAEEEKIQEFLRKGIRDITVDVLIMAGRKQ